MMDALIAISCVYINNEILIYRFRPFEAWGFVGSDTLTLGAASQYGE
jgi:hypothetical protein